MQDEGLRRIVGRSKTSLRLRACGASANSTKDQVALRLQRGKWSPKGLREHLPFEGGTGISRLVASFRNQWLQPRDDDFPDPSVAKGYLRKACRHPSIAVIGLLHICQN